MKANMEITSIYVTTWPPYLAIACRLRARAAPTNRGQEASSFQANLTRTNDLTAQFLPD